MGRAIQVEFLLAGVTDSSGEPLASGKVYTYEAGTTSNKTTYTDQGKTTSAANPVILGARGNASIFAEGAYKFVIKDSSDNTIITIDGLQYVYPDNFNIYAGTSTGSSNAYILSPSPTATAYVDGTTYTFVANFASTGAATLNVSGLGAKSFVKNDGSTALGVGDILSSMLVNAQYISGSNHFRLVSAAGVLALSGGGTGASTAADARTNLGIGSGYMASQATSAVSISGGTITGITDLAVADGGTGSSTAANARTALGCAASGANGDITSLTAVTAVGNTTTNTDVKCGTGFGTAFYEGATIKAQIPSGTTSGSAGFIPWTDNNYTLGTASNCWQLIYTKGILGRAANNLTIASEATRSIEMKAGNSTAYWTFSPAGQLVWSSAPTYSFFTFTTRRSLDPTAATAATCADAINTISADLVTAGIFKI